MDRYNFEVSLTPAAREMLCPGEVLVLDWHRIAVCCAGAGDRRGLVRLKGEAPIYAARAIFQHLSGREILLDARKTLGIRRFTSNLPSDFGMRAVFGRLPEGELQSR